VAEEGGGMVRNDIIINALRHNDMQGEFEQVLAKQSLS
jgi:hypothetical protein